MTLKSCDSSITISNSKSVHGLCLNMDSTYDKRKVSIIIMEFLSTRTRNQLPMKSESAIKRKITPERQGFTESDTYIKKTP